VNSFMRPAESNNLFILCASAVWFGAAVWFCFAQDYLPLDNLVFSGVRALATETYTYSSRRKGATEGRGTERGVCEKCVENCWIRSGSDLRRRESRGVGPGAASSISHDLRHYRASVVANAEFLYERKISSSRVTNLLPGYKTASTQMTSP